ncbi:hypothetical protein Tco_0178084 [Tanacetum coccineum]
MDQRSKRAVEALLRANHGANTDVLRHSNETILSGTDHVTHVETDTDCIQKHEQVIADNFLFKILTMLLSFLVCPFLLSEIDDFTIELEAGNNQLWLGQLMKATMVENNEVSLDDPIVKIVDVNDKPSSYVSAAGGSKTEPMKPKANHPFLVHNITSSNSFAALNEDVEEGEIENVFDETANLFNSKTGGRSSFMADVG